jgi:hypothetical protein
MGHSSNPFMGLLFNKAYAIVKLNKLKQKNMTQPTNPDLKKMMNGEHADEEPLRIVEDGIVTIPREDFNLLRGVNASDELWKNFLAERNIQPNKLYEFHITESDGTETIGAYGTDETREVNGVTEDFDEHLTKHPAETAQLLEKYKNQPEQLDEIKRTEIIDEMGDTAVQEVAEAPSDAQSMRERLRAAMGESTTTEPEVVAEDTEKLINETDAMTARNIINQLAVIEEGIRSGAVSSKEEAEYHRNHFVGSMSAEMSEKFRKGTVGKEAYVFINSALLGSSQDGQIMSDVLRGLNNSGALSERDVDIIHSQMVNIEHASRMSGEAREQYLGKLSYDLDQIAANMYPSKDNKVSEAYIAVQGIIAGVAAQMSSWHGGTRVSGAIEHVTSLKR